VGIIIGIIASFSKKKAELQVSLFLVMAKTRVDSQERLGWVLKKP